MNNFISFGLHKLIKKDSIEHLEIKNGSKILDLCCGSGDITNLLNKKNNIGQIIGIDFSEKMLEIAKSKIQKQNSDTTVLQVCKPCVSSLSNTTPGTFAHVPYRAKKIFYINGDCTNLPFDNKSFDICTISFGFRNIEDKEKCLDEISRVLKEDGQFLHLDFVKNNSLIFKFYKYFVLFFTKLFGNNSAYLYLIKSIENYYTNQELTEIFKKHNLYLVKNKNYAFGNIAMQICKKI